jgi:C-terminal processing protease CtpA/Prc
LLLGVKEMRTIITCIALLLTLFVSGGVSQDIGFERARHKAMLYAIKTDVEKNYYDPNFKNIDLESKYNEALANIQKAGTIGELNASLAQFLLELDDSHTVYLPPPRVKTVDYGLWFRMVGDKCRIIWLDDDSDAKKKGIQVGDEIRALSGYLLTRDTIWRTRYFFFALMPQAQLTLDIVKLDGTVIRQTVEPKITTGSKIVKPDVNQMVRDSEKYIKEATRQYFYDKLDGAFIWRMPAFSVDRYKVDDVLEKARRYPAIIFDLRGNPGGSADMAIRLVSDVFDKDVKIADEKRRKETREIISRSKGKDSYSGKIVFLIDSDSASAAEVFARVIQLENRGIVIGDRSAGAVMASRLFDHQFGTEVVTPYAATITVADLIMKDGKSLEKVGVMPDIVLLPTPQDMSAKRDVVLAKALQMVGIDVTPEVAGTFFAKADKDQK